MTPSPRTLSLFEQEIRDQIAAAEAAVVEAVRRADALLEQAARNHLDSLVGLARRNGVIAGPAEDATSEVPAVA